LKSSGVSWREGSKKWRAQIDTSADGKRKRKDLGLYLNEVDAALAYDQAAREYHKDKAKLNFPDLPPQPAPEPAVTKPWIKRRSPPVSQYHGKSRCISALDVSREAAGDVYSKA
jgi:hypothetical protein